MIKIAAIGVLACSGMLFAAGDLNEDFTALKAAVEKKDAAGVKSLAPTVSKEAKETLAKPDTAKDVADFAKGADSYSEYALASVAAQVPASTIELTDLLIQQNPKSQYLDTVAIPYVDALARQSPAKAAAGAGKILAGAKPENMSDADWEKRKSLKSGLGYYYAGIGAATRQVWADCDRNLKAALPLIASQQTMVGNAYFYLGLANYQMGKLTDNRNLIQVGLKYSEQSAAIAGPMQAQANNNVTAMKQALAGPTKR